MTGVGNDSSWIRRGLYSFGSFMFLTEHWIFVMLYFRVAVIFKLVFSFHNEKIRAELRRREKLILIFGITVFLLTDVPLLLSMFTKGINFDFTYKILKIIGYAVPVVTQCIAIWRIRKFSKRLVANEVFVNERLMCMHLFFFTLKATINITISVLSLCLYE
jgi:hypothetical protein